jgi:hypothetical protein
MDARTSNQQQLLAFASEPVISFRCECGDPDCRQTVPLAPSAYRGLRIKDDALLHPGHTPLEDAPLAAESLWVSAEEARVRAVSAALKLP